VELENNIFSSKQ